MVPVGADRNVSAHFRLPIKANSKIIHIAARFVITITAFMSNLFTSVNATQRCETAQFSLQTLRAGTALTGLLPSFLCINSSNLCF